MTVKELREVISKYDDDKEINIMIEDVYGLQSPSTYGTCSASILWATE